MGIMRYDDISGSGDPLVLTCDQSEDNVK
jgi:hypothetical protein